MSFLEIMRAVNAHDLSAHLPFCFKNLQLGWVGQGFATLLTRYPSVFLVEADRVELRADLPDFDARSAALAEVLHDLKAKGHVPGWRDELYPALADDGGAVLFVLERAAARLFGLRTLNIHLLGYVGEGRDLRLWVAKRSTSKPTGPGQKDVLVGGGMAYGQSPVAAMIREAWEEAGLGPEIAGQAKPVGELRYLHQDKLGLEQGRAFQFELRLDEAVRPENRDGEVAGFELVPYSQVMEEIAAGKSYYPGYLYDSNLAFIAFFLRHGFIAADDPDYGHLVAGLGGALG